MAKSWIEKACKLQRPGCMLELSYSLLPYIFHRCNIVHNVRFSIHASRTCCRQLLLSADRANRKWRDDDVIFGWKSVHERVVVDEVAIGHVFIGQLVLVFVISHSNEMVIARHYSVVQCVLPGAMQTQQNSRRSGDGRSGSGSRWVNDEDIIWQWRKQKFWKGGGAEYNVSVPSSFITNAHNELYTRFVRLKATWEGKTFLRPIGAGWGGRPHHQIPATVVRQPHIAVHSDSYLSWQHSHYTCTPSVIIVFFCNFFSVNGDSPPAQHFSSLGAPNTRIRIRNDRNVRITLNVDEGQTDNCRNWLLAWTRRMKLVLGARGDLRRNLAKSRLTLAHSGEARYRRRRQPTTTFPPSHSQDFPHRKTRDLWSNSRALASRNSVCVARSDWRRRAMTTERCPAHRSRRCMAGGPQSRAESLWRHRESAADDHQTQRHMTMLCLSGREYNRSNE